MVMLLNLLSVIIFSLDASLNSSKKPRSCAETILIALVTTFGGGAIIRDIVILHELPGCLNDTSDIIVCIIVSVLSYMMRVLNLHNIFYYSTISKIRYVMDKLGIATFITAGLLKGLSYGTPYLLTILCGVAPGIGGGTIAKAIYESPYYALKSRIKEIICAFLISSFTYPLAISVKNERILIIYSFIIALFAFFFVDNMKKLKQNIHLVCIVPILPILTKSNSVIYKENIILGYFQNKNNISKSFFKKIIKIPSCSFRHRKYRYVLV